MFISASRSKVAVLGGGISGLVSALRLAQSGHRVSVLEASAELGGLAASFEHEGHILEQFPHVLSPSDTHLLQLLEELDLAGDVSWVDAGTGILFQRSLYSLNSTCDLLSYGGLSLSGRLRAAAGCAYLSNTNQNRKGLDHIGVADWLVEMFGAEAFTQWWRPMLRSHFGDGYETVPAQWLWTRLLRERTDGVRRKGFVNGGYQRIVERLRTEIRRLGGVIRLRTPVDAIREAPGAIQLQICGEWESVETAVATLPLPLLHPLVHGRLKESVPRSPLPYQGVVNAVAILNNSLQPNYWNAILHPSVAFHALVEATHVTPLAQTGGRHIVHLLNHCAAGSESYSHVDADFKFQALKALKVFNPRFTQDWVEDVYVFRSPFAEPLWPLGSQRDRLRMRCGDSGLYLATSAQCYPHSNSCNTLIGIANDLAARIRFDLDNTAARAASGTASAMSGIR